MSQPSDGTPQQDSKRLLATGGADEKINLYQISACAPKGKTTPLDASSNKEVGALLHHSATISTLSFPSRGKLVSGALDNTIAISRVRDWTVLSSIKVPIPNAQGRPSGDTAAPGEVPAGINDVAVHPSAKLALSVGQGERCMRLWNLITGKRGGVLTFEKKMLAALGEGRWRRGEARSVLWSPDGELFAVGFERGVLLYGLDCKIRGMIKVEATKICRLRFVPQSTRVSQPDDEVSEPVSYTLAMSTEDGRVLFYNTSADLDVDGVLATLKDNSEHEAQVPTYLMVSQMGEVKRGSRIKDFVVLPHGNTQYLVVTGSSDGLVQIWSLDVADIQSGELPPTPTKQKANDDMNGGQTPQPTKVAPVVGTLLGSHETHKRITCLEAFMLDGTARPAAQANDSAVSGVDEGSDEADDFAGFEEDEAE